MSEGQRGGEFFTPTSLVKLIVEIIQPFHGRILDPACGSGGMFVQSAAFIYQQVSRAHREFTPVQLEFLANIVRLYRGEAPENRHDSADFLASKFPDTAYIDVPGLCKVATIAEIETQGWSLNPGRYVGVDEQTTDDFDFTERFTQLNEELAVLNAEAHQLEERIAENVAKILENTI